MHDLHTHSNYSDGAFLEAMVSAAVEAGLDGIGISDHCYVSDRDALCEARDRVGMNLDLTFERRRRAIKALREETPITIYDAVELDYDPRDRDTIEQFQERADFDYTIGSVHRIDDVNIQVESRLEPLSEEELETMVDNYYDTLVDLVESELFEIAAHLDLPKRTPSLCGRANEDHYHRVAEAFTRSRTVPEINVGRALTETEIVHPEPTFFDVLEEYDVSFTVGSDSHSPAQVADRTPFLEEFLETHDLDPVAPSSLE